MEEISIADQIQEVQRELRLRAQVYPRWTSGQNPRLSKGNAELHLARLRAVLASLEELQRLRQVAVCLGAVVSRHAEGVTYTLRFRTEAERGLLGVAIDSVLCPIEFPVDGTQGG